MSTVPSSSSSPHSAAAFATRARMFSDHRYNREGAVSEHMHADNYVGMSTAELGLVTHHRSDLSSGERHGSYTDGQVRVRVLVLLRLGVVLTLVFCRCTTRTTSTTSTPPTCRRTLTSGCVFFSSSTRPC